MDCSPQWRETSLRRPAADKEKSSRAVSQKVQIITKEEMGKVGPRDPGRSALGAKLLGRNLNREIDKFSSSLRKGESTDRGKAHEEERPHRKEARAANYRGTALQRPKEVIAELNS